MSFPAMATSNKFDSFNPLYTQQQSHNEQKENTDNAKAIKRSDKQTRDTIVRTNKDTANALETKMDELGTAVNQAMTKQMALGFDKLSGQIGELVNFLKNNAKEQSDKNPENLAIQPPGRVPNFNLPNQDQRLVNPHEMSLSIPEIQLVPTKPSQPEIQSVMDSNQLSQQLDNLTKDYDRIMNRMSTLPPGQRHLPTNWAENDPEFPLDGDSSDKINQKTDEKSDTTQNLDDSKRTDAKITDLELKTLFNTIDTRQDLKFKDMENKLNNCIQTIQRLETRINQLEEKKMTLKEDEKDKETKTTYAQAAAKPTLIIDLDGNQIVTQEQRTHKQPLDNVKVKNIYKQLPPRPELSTSTQQEAGEKLDVHNKETAKQIEDNTTKMKKQMDIDKKDRDKIIEQMLARSSCELGIAPLTKQQTYKACELMTKKGILKRTENLDTRLQRTTRSLVKSWTKKHLQMEDNESSKVTVESLCLRVPDCAGVIKVMSVMQTESILCQVFY